jgi:hypothetical protein
MGKFSYSTDGESYYGRFDTFEEAKHEAISEGAKFVGEAIPPPAPEDYFDADDWIEHVSCQDEYSLDCAEDWCRPTKEQLDELNREVRAVMASWLDRHKLRPTFWLIENAVRLRDDELAHVEFRE